MSTNRAFRKSLLARSYQALRVTGEFVLATLLGLGVTGCSGDVDPSDDTTPDDATPDKQISYDGAYEAAEDTKHDVLSPDGAPPTYDGGYPYADGAPNFDGGYPYADGMPEAMSYDGGYVPESGLMMDGGMGQDGGDGGGWKKDAGKD